MKEFENIIGYESIKQELYRLCDIIKDCDKYKNLGVKIPKGLLLYGDPGVGKTTMAKCFIKASGIKNVFNIGACGEFDNFIDYIVCEFNKANQNLPSIVFLDDFDKFSNGDIKHKDTQEYVTIQTCIDECKEGVFVIGTCNDINNLPSSLLRVGRFDNKFELGKPGLEDAEKIVKHYLKDKMVDDSVDFMEVAKMLNGGSCADLEFIINTASLYAGKNGKEKISREDIIKTYFKKYSYTDKKSLNKKVLEKIAVHEAGHIVMQQLLMPEDFVMGSISSFDTDSITDIILNRKNITKQDCEDKVKVLLSGRAATEIVYGDLDMASYREIEKASSIIKGLIKKVCEYEFFNRGNSDFQIEKIEIIIEKELIRNYNLVKKILIKNEKFLHKVKRELINNDYILKENLEKIKKNTEIIPVEKIYMRD